MATDLEISQRIGRAVAAGLEDDPSMLNMLTRLLTMAAGFAAGVGDSPLVCEGAFLDAARRLYRYARQPPIVACPKCHQKNRLKLGPALAGNPICAACKAPIIPGLTAFLRDEDASKPATN